MGWVGVIFSELGGVIVFGWVGGLGGVIYFVGVGKGNRFWYSRKIVRYQITHYNFLVNGL